MNLTVIPPGALTTNTPIAITSAGAPALARNGTRTGYGLVRILP